MAAGHDVHIHMDFWEYQTWFTHIFYVHTLFTINLGQLVMSFNEECPLKPQKSNHRLEFTVGGSVYSRSVPRLSITERYMTGYSSGERRKEHKTVVRVTLLLCRGRRTLETLIYRQPSYVLSLYQSDGLRHNVICMMQVIYLYITKTCRNI